MHPHPTTGVLAVDFAAMGLDLQALAQTHWQYLGQEYRPTGENQQLPEFINFIVHIASHFDQYRGNPTYVTDFLTTELFEYYDADVDAGPYIATVAKLVLHVLSLMPSTCYCGQLLGVQRSMGYVHLTPTPAE
jgi:hypothetical protein